MGHLPENLCLEIYTDQEKKDSPTVTQVPPSQHLLPGLVEGQLSQGQETDQKILGQKSGLGESSRKLPAKHPRERCKVFLGPNR